MRAWRDAWGLAQLPACGLEVGRGGPGVRAGEHGLGVGGSGPGAGAGLGTGCGARPGVVRGVGQQGRLVSPAQGSGCRWRGLRLADRRGGSEKIEQVLGCLVMRSLKWGLKVLWWALN